MSTPKHEFMRMHPGYSTGEQPPQRNQRSAARTAAIVAGGAGLAYGGVKVGRAADQARRTAKASEAAATKAAQVADDMAAITRPIRKAGRAVKRVLRMGAKPQKAVAFAQPNVARDRYVKGIHEKDVHGAAGQYAKSGAAGALAGLALRKGGSRKLAAFKGAGAGLAIQGATRAATAQTRDAFGDRSPGAKLADKLPAPALAAAALVAASPKLRKQLRTAKAATARTAKRGVKAAPRVAGQVLGEAFRNVVGFSRGRAVRHGAALAGGIAAADALTHGIFPDRGKTRGEAARDGLTKGAVYGAGLALAEPAILAALKRAKLPVRRPASRAIVPLAARIPVIAFRGRQQLYTDDHPTAKRIFADPYKVATGEQTGYTIDEKGQKHHEDYGVRHAQVINSAMRKGRDAYKWGGRAGRLAGDAAGALQGRRKVDERGRPLKREWEKSYFKNMVGSAAVAGGLLLHARQMRKNPNYRAKVIGAKKAAMRKANQVVPDLFQEFAARRAPIAFRRVGNRHIAFDVTAPDWDVRDQRGRSARVFAPGSRPRQRREKRWHEKTENIRRLAVAGALLAGAGGGVLGYRLGKQRGARITPKKPVGAATPDNVIRGKFA